MILINWKYIIKPLKHSTEPQNTEAFKNSACRKIIGISSYYFPEENTIHCFCKGEAVLFANYELYLKVLFAKFQVSHIQYIIEAKF